MADSLRMKISQITKETKINMKGFTKEATRIILQENSPFTCVLDKN